MEKKLTIKLFDPGMSHLHRVGLAGLYMTLKYFDEHKINIINAGWELNNEQVTLYWQGDDEKFFDSLFKVSFSSDSQGLIDFAAHRGMLIGDLEKVFLNDVLLMTYLQHPKQNKIPKGSNRIININFNDKSVIVNYKPFGVNYAHIDAAKDITDKQRRLKERINIKGWLYPGAIKRHEKISASELEEPPGRFLSLIYAPTASLYYRLSHKNRDGKYDKRRSAAIILPHIDNLASYAQCYRRCLNTPVDKLYADGLADAGMAALLTLRAGEKLDTLGVTGCTIIIMGSLAWAKQQKTRSFVAKLEGIDDNCLDLFELAYKILPNKIFLKVPVADENRQGNTYDVGTSLSRGLIAENLASGRDWFRGFVELMNSKKQAELVSYEKGGLNQMVNENIWSFETDKQFIEALHTAIKNRYGALAARTRSGERIPFDKEFERMRTGLMRSKNAASLRAELADIFARGGINLPLQENWRELLPLFTGKDWQRARDLALLALASYSGSGAVDAMPVVVPDDEENESNDID
ncbi:CRISPR-associated protein Cas8a1/Csx13 [Sporotomaculum syntrophicum]|uniref:CRISPR-associated protein Cas8a1/Csx13 n=1 Tax=Sporotomaculum syntrophicum TaxID=182264 RepID=A0A9D3AX24_9FIRM|nr:type I-MYXAN CRISPR-associated Cas8a1/Cmx1 [Sporotomaculum syntrophicum]KAF1083921.1 CRISPR-associated protein Cas8a1/Csx13 [Sporotomaculum syntrophicum]